MVKERSFTDKEKRDREISENLGLVHSIAHRFKGRGIEYDDLYSAGCIGLVKAYDGFKPELGNRFSTYAVPVIMGEMKRLFRDGGAVKVGRALKELSIKASRFTNEFVQRHGYEPSLHQLAQALEVSPEEAAQALTVSMPVLSLTAEEDDGGGQLDVRAEDSEEKLSEHLALKQVVDALEPKDRNLIVLRYFKGKTQTETAKVLGMTQVQVSRREKVILQSLRKELVLK